MLRFIKRCIQRLVLFCITALFGVIAIWIVGLGLFVQEIYHQKVPADNIHTDAVVVLTGGGDRVKEGVRMLRQGMAESLFISGVGQGVTVEDILRTTDNADRVNDAIFKARITLGRAAENTNGNATETVAWAELHRVHSIRLVTAYYHMPRSRLEFHFMVPQFEILAHPVYPANFHPFEGNSLQLASLEYHKFIAVLLRQAGLWQPS